MRLLECFFFIIGNLLSSCRQSKIIEDGVSFFFVTGNADRNLPCFTGDRCLNSALIFSVTKLNQTVAVEPQVRDITFFCRIDQGACARTEFMTLRKTDESVTFLFKIKIRRRHGFDLLAEFFRQKIQ